MAQQTAVDYFVNLYYAEYDILLPSEDYANAKQMEKEQIINAWRNGDNDSMYEPNQLDEQAEQYYDETYNK